jgi:hypothetical protein
MVQEGHGISHTRRRNFPTLIPGIKNKENFYIHRTCHKSTTSKGENMGPDCSHPISQMEKAFLGRRSLAISTTPTLGYSH